MRQGLASCPQVPGRLEIVARQPVVAVDFAHTPDALARTCDAARLLAGDHRVMVVFGAGGGRDKEKRGPMGRAVGERADLAFVTNDNPRHEKPADIAKAVMRVAARAAARTFKWSWTGARRSAVPWSTASWETSWWRLAKGPGRSDDR